MKAFICIIISNFSNNSKHLCNCSKHEDEEYAYLVAMNIGSGAFDDPMNLDFTSVWPEMPEKGLLYTMAGPGQGTYPNSFCPNSTYQYEKE